MSNQQIIAVSKSGDKNLLNLSFPNEWKIKECNIPAKYSNDYIDGYFTCDGKRVYVSDILCKKSICLTTLPGICRSLIEKYLVPTKALDYVCKHLGLEAILTDSSIEINTIQIINSDTHPLGGLSECLMSPGMEITSAFIVDDMMHSFETVPALINMISAKGRIYSRRCAINRKLLEMNMANQRGLVVSTNGNAFLIAELSKETGHYLSRRSAGYTGDDGWLEFRGCTTSSIEGSSVDVVTNSHKIIKYFGVHERFDLLKDFDIDFFRGKVRQKT